MSTTNELEEEEQRLRSLRKDVEKQRRKLNDEVEQYEKGRKHIELKVVKAVHVLCIAFLFN